MAYHEKASTKHQRGAHIGQSRNSGEPGPFDSKKKVVLFILVYAFFPWSPPTRRQKRALNLRTALIVMSRTILMGHFVPPERNVHNSVDTHKRIEIQIGGDIMITPLTRVITMLNQR